MEVTTDEVELDSNNCLISNNGPDILYVGKRGTDTDDWYPIASGSSISIDWEYGDKVGVVSAGVSDVGVLYGGTGIFPPPVVAEEVDLSPYELISSHTDDMNSLASSVSDALAAKQPLDSDLTAIAALTTTSYGRTLLTLANALAADWSTDAEVAAAIAAAVAAYQPLDSDLTAIAALTTTSYGRTLLTLANAAAADWATDSEVAASIAAAVASYQPLDSDLTAIAALTTTSYGRALLSLANAASADWVPNALFDANTMLVAHTDNTPVAVSISANQVVGRGNSGNIKGLTAAETAAIVSTEVFTQGQAFNAQTGTTYTLVAGDAGKNVTLSNASAITLTLPQDSDATIAIGTYVDLTQLGAGQVTVAAGSGATLRTSGLTAKARAQYSRLGVQKISANTWSLFGDLASS